MGEQLRLHQAEEAARAVSSERTWIARELHDIVTHYITVISLKAQVVPCRNVDVCLPVWRLAARSGCPTCRGNAASCSTCDNLFDL
jgi:hypothetical protein